MSTLSERIADAVAEGLDDHDQIDALLREVRLILATRFLMSPSAVPETNIIPRSLSSSLGQGQIGRPKSLSPAMRRVAAALLSAPPGLVVPRYQLLAAATAAPSTKSRKLLHVYICRLRRLLAEAGCQGVTIDCFTRRGYLLRPDCRDRLALLAQWTPDKGLLQ